MDISNWLIKDGTNPIYYGYAIPGTSTGDTKWIIMKETTAGDVLEREWADNNFLYDKIWADKEAYFTDPVAATLNYSAVTYVSGLAQIRVDWNYSSGTTKYYVTLLDENDKAVLPWNTKYVELNDQKRIVATLDAEVDSTYKVRIIGKNGYGESVSEFTVTT